LPNMLPQTPVIALFGNLFTRFFGDPGDVSLGVETTSAIQPRPELRELLSTTPSSVAI